MLGPCSRWSSVSLRVRPGVGGGLWSGGTDEGARARGSRDASEGGGKCHLVFAFGFHFSPVFSLLPPLFVLHFSFP